MLRLLIQTSVALVLSLTSSNVSNLDSDYCVEIRFRAQALIKNRLRLPTQLTDFNILNLKSDENVETFDPNICNQVMYQI